jgi:hypothetical protein
MKNLLQLAVPLLIVIVIASCSSSTSTNPALTEGKIYVTTKTTGAVDCTTVKGGFHDYTFDLIAVNRRIHITPNDSMYIDNVDEGPRAAKLLRIPDECSVIKGDNPLNLNITAGDTTYTSFEMSCKCREQYADSVQADTMCVYVDSIKIQKAQSIPSVAH